MKRGPRTRLGAARALAAVGLAIAVASGCSKTGPAPGVDAAAVDAAVIPRDAGGSGGCVCPKSDVASCGLDGTCDEQGRCRPYRAGTVCKPGVCQDGAVIGTEVCDGAGRCAPGPQTVCAPFGCDAASGQCASTCRSDGDCMPGVACVAGSCGPKPQGAVCQKASDCASGFCADGVCCNVACTGACVSCNQPAQNGTCWPVEAGNADPHAVCRDQGGCGQTGACDGLGGCAMSKVETVCAPPSCSGDVLIAAATCDGLGTCRTPARQSCAPYRCVGSACVDRCASDGDCVAGQSCQNGSCGPKPNGHTCGAASECASGFCVDGVCCDSGCTSACHSCGLPSAPGTCTPAAAGALDPRGACVDQGAASCGTDGTCDGAGGCRRYKAGTTCNAPQCLGGSFTDAAACDGTGHCVAPAAVSCAPFACNGSRCFTACTSDANCAPGLSCVGNSCGKAANGTACAGDGQCASGHCTDGFCCGAAACGACSSCGVKGSEGTCAAVADGTACGARSCSTLLGTIVGGQCVNGICASVTLTSCTPFNCDSATGSCNTTCKTPSDCAPGYTCNASGGNGRSCN